MVIWGPVNRVAAVVCATTVAVTLAVTGPAASATPVGRDDDQHPTETERRQAGLDGMPELPAVAPIGTRGSATRGHAAQGLAGAPPAEVRWPDPGKETSELGATGPHAVTAGPVTLTVDAAPAAPPAGATAAPAAAAGAGAGAASRAHAAAAPTTAAPTTPPVDASVEVLGRDAASALGVDGIVLDASATGLPDDELVDVTVDYSGFAGAYGGDWASRLTLVALPDCAATTPRRSECRVRTDVGARNDPTTHTLTASVAASSMGVMAVTAAATGPSGNWAATPLSPSSQWQVSPQVGSFSWTYPITTPGTPGGLEPSLSLSYSSSGVDGRVSSSNNQTSLLGEGWDITSSYIERKYVSCSEDMTGGNNASRKTYDLCWSTDNATLVLNGQSMELVKDKTTGAWRAVNDDATRVERFTGAANGDNDGEYWKVTTTDGTQYVFGRERRDSSTTNLGSTWTVPVFGNNAGEPCYQSTFASSSCPQAWRWNLEYVTDTLGNSMTYFYVEEGNRYGRNLNTAVSDYVRGGYLDHIEYGQRAGAETTAAPVKVVFTTAERCIPLAGVIDCAPGSLTSATAKYWPDVPFDQICASTATSCPSVVAPAFFSRKRLTQVTTQVYNGSAYQNVDQWALTHTFPDPGDGTGAALWLNSVQRTGLVGGTIATPAITFHGVQMANRVDQTGDIGPAMNRYRIDSLTTESGAVVSVNYSPKDCSPGDVPGSPDANTRRCFPVSWTPQGMSAPLFEYFHKYLVTSVVVDGRQATSAPQVSTYSYIGAPAWRYDDSPLVPEKQRTWSDFRGYAAVDVTTGVTPDQSTVRHEYFRGMNGDKVAAGGTRAVTVDGRADDDPLNGFEFAMTTYNGPGVEVSRTHNVPWLSDPTATGADGTTARFLKVAATGVRTTGSALPGGQRTTRTWMTYDSTYGMPTQVYDEGDVAVTGDERCTTTTYARTSTTTAYLVDKVARTETHGTACTSTPTYPADAIADTRILYDGLAYGAGPTKGLATSTQEAKDYQSGAPVYLTTSTTAYDSYGRPTSVSDALSRTTTTAYTQTNGLLTKTVVSTPDPDGSTGPKTAFSTTTEYAPARGTATKVTDPNGKVTTGTYDALGRLTAVWQPGRPQGTYSASTTYAYTLSSTGVNAVTTSSLTPSQAYVTSVALYDGMLRPIQTQTQTKSGTTSGRLVTDTFYEARGLVQQRSSGWFAAGAPAAAVATPTSTIPGATRFEYDLAGRTKAEVTIVDGTEKWRTTTAYDGDRVTVDPPTGGVPQTTITDARGQLVQLWQYTGGDPAGDHTTTSYAYDKAGRLTGVTDDAGNTWSSAYDVRGRLVGSTDPDKGATSSTYDDAGQVLTTTDARGTTLAYVYDQLGRKTELHDGTATGTLRARWAYDTLAKGQLDSSTRYTSEGAFTTAVTGYDDGYRVLGQSVTLPSSYGTLAGPFTTGFLYAANGAARGVSYPAAGGLAAETVTTSFDTLGRPLSYGGGSAWGLYVVSTQYSPYGEVAAYDLGNTTPTYLTYEYEAGTRRLLHTQVKQSGSTDYVMDLTYTYDAAGNPTSVVDRPAGQPVNAQCYGYDGLRRLTQAWTPAYGDCAAAPSVDALGGPQPYWFTDGFDTIGNRTSRVVHAAAGDQTSTYTYPASGAGVVRPHGLLGVTTTGAGAGDPASFGYDAAGNTLTRDPADGAAQALTWDAEGRLTQVSEAGSAVGEYVYSADGDRLVRREGGVTTVYLPGGEELSRDASGAVKATRYYAFNGQTFAVRTGSGYAGVTSLVSDPHATAQLGVDNTTNAVTRRYTDPYGNAQGSTGTWVGDHGFLNKPADATGLLAVGARYYDPAVGRFISVDPVMTLTDPQQWAAYTYANNNPVTYWDPTGLWPDWLDHAAKSVTNGVKSAWHGASNGVRTAWNHSAKWVRDHQADIVAGVAGYVVGGGCMLLTAGAGSLACAALGGAASGAASHLWRSQVQHTEKFSWSSLARESLIGGVTGVATAGVGNLAARGASALASRGAQAAAGEARAALGGAARAEATAAANTAAAPRTWSNLAPGDPLFPGRTVPLDRLSSVNGRFQYVVREDGSLVVGRGGHIDLSRGADVLAAGEVRVVNGEVRMLNNASGHYQPDGSIAGVARTAFEQQTGLVVRGNAWQTVPH